MGAQLSDAELLARLIAFNTVSTNSNAPMADFICDYLEGPNVEIARLPTDDGQKINLVIRTPATDPTGGDRPGLSLCGHMDVVPAVEPEWNSDPFTLIETEEAYVGRGTCDMKGFVALAINSLKTHATSKLKHALTLILTHDEEVGCHGAIRLANSWDNRFPLPTSTIVGEPTSLRAVRMHKGQIAMRLTVCGVSAHSGYPDFGVNAIEPAARIILALAELRNQLRGERHENSEFFPETPYVALNVTMVSGGTAINIIPDRCTIGIDARPLPGMDSAPLLARIHKTIESVPDRGDCAVELLHDDPPMLLPQDSITNRRVCELLGQAQSHGASYSTDAGFLQSMGLECILLGPGDIAVAHKPNESLLKSQFQRARTLLENLIRLFCSEP